MILLYLLLVVRLMGRVMKQLLRDCSCSCSSGTPSLMRLVRLLMITSAVGALHLHAGRRGEKTGIEQGVGQVREAGIKERGGKRVVIMCVCDCSSAAGESRRRRRFVIPAFACAAVVSQSCSSSCRSRALSYTGDTHLIPEERTISSASMMIAHLLMKCIHSWLIMTLLVMMGTGMMSRRRRSGRGVIHQQPDPSISRPGGSHFSASSGF